MKGIRRHASENREAFKFENARVEVVSLPSGEYGVGFKVLSDDLKPRAVHIVEKGKVVATSLKISAEAAMSLMYGLQERLRKDGILI